MHWICEISSFAREDKKIAKKRLGAWNGKEKDSK